VSCHYPSEDRVLHDISCRSILVSDRRRVFVEPHLSSQKFLELLSFSFFIFALCYFSVSLFCLSRLSLFLDNIADRFGDSAFDGVHSTKTRSVLASSRTPLHSNSASIRIVTLKSHYLHIDMYTYILALMRIPLRLVRKFNDNLLFCILEYRRETNLLIHY